MFIIAIAFVLGAKFLISDPGLDDRMHFTIPAIDNFPVFSCPFYTITGLPCPVCGITRASALAVRGDFAGSFRAHPLGPLLVVCMFFAIPLTFFVFLKPEKKSGPPAVLMTGKTLSIIIAALALLSWIINLARHFHIIGW